MYVQLTEAETAFRTLKSELGLRPIYHRVAERIEAHILVAFLGYAMWVCLKHRLKAKAALEDSGVCRDFVCIRRRGNVDRGLGIFRKL